MQERGTRNEEATRRLGSLRLSSFLVPRSCRDLPPSSRVSTVDRITGFVGRSD